MYSEICKAVKGKDVKDENGNTYTGEEAIAETVVKNFICQYYTWTNKDGNYDIGGMQYIYTPKQSDFETYTLYNFYKDMDLYLSKDGRSSLIEVKKVTINNVSRVDDYTVTYTDENGDEQSAGLPCVKVEAMKERIKLINPECKVEAKQVFVTAENIPDLITDDIDYVVDAIDTVTSKLALAEYCYKNEIKI